VGERRETHSLDDSNPYGEGASPYGEASLLEEEEDTTTEVQLPHPHEPSTPSSLRALASKIDGQIARDGGKSGGWHQDEHAAFLKAYTRAGGDLERVVQAVRAGGAVLSSKSDDEVVGHGAWHRVNLRRLECKKELAGMWREGKERARKEAVGRHEESAKAKEKAAKGGELSEGEQNRAREGEKEKRDAIRAWREGKLREEKTRLEEAEEKKEEERLRREQKQEEHVFLRARVNEYKGRREEEREREVRVKEMARKSERVEGIGEEEMERRRGREIGKARERREKIERDKGEKARGAARLRGLAGAATAHVTRDFGRLTGGTAAANARAYTSEELDDHDTAKRTRSAHDNPVFFSGRDLGFGGGAGRRATPSWRKGV